MPDDRRQPVCATTLTSRGSTLEQGKAGRGATNPLESQTRTYTMHNIYKNSKFKKQRLYINSNIQIIIVSFENLEMFEMLKTYFIIFSSS